VFAECPASAPTAQGFILHGASVRDEALLLDPHGPAQGHKVGKKEARPGWGEPGPRTSMPPGANSSNMSLPVSTREGAAQ
jgi:hypothetical protein